MMQSPFVRRRPLLATLLLAVAIATTSLGSAPVARAESPSGETPRTLKQILTFERSRLHLLDFRAGYYLLLLSAGTTYSWVLSWNPRYELTDNIGVSLDAGFSVLLSSGRLVPVLEYGLRGTYTREIKGLKFFGELGVGARTFLRTTSASSTSFAVDTVIGYQHPKKILWFLERAFVGYSLLLIPSATSHQVRVGIGASI